MIRVSCVDCGPYLGFPFASGTKAYASYSRGRLPATAAHSIGAAPAPSVKCGATSTSASSPTPWRSNDRKNSGTSTVEEASGAGMASAIARPSATRRGTAYAGRRTASSPTRTATIVAIASHM